MTKRIGLWKKTIFRSKKTKSALVVISALPLLFLACREQTTQEFTGEWTADNYPPYIRRVTYFGERADWSHDGKRILFIEKTFGDVYEVELETGIIRPKTNLYFHEGYTRALYLANGDILLSGARKFDAEDPWPSRRSEAELWVLDKSGEKPPVPLGTKCSEGPAVSRKNMRIAWTIDHDDYPDQLPEGVSQIWVGDIVYEDGTPKLVNRRLVLDSRNLPFKCNLETQNFVPPDEKFLTVALYGYQGTEVGLLNLETGEVQNMSKAPGQYDEPEGIFPNGKWTLVECDKHTGPNFKGSRHIDLYALKLDGSGEYRRITYFNEGGIWKASNPVVSDDGRYIAFQVPKAEMVAGMGLGIYILDLEAAGLKFE